MNSFGTVLYRLRVSYFGKQQCLAFSIGCTEAAVSFWESERRLPSPQFLSKLVKRLIKAGASATEVKELVTTYQDEQARKHFSKLPNF
jgi:DNA-binding transcriptional regulator YiaG